MTRKRDVSRKISTGRETVKYIERDRGHYTERMLKPHKPLENNVSGSYVHVTSGLRVSNESVHFRDAHVDVYEGGQKKKTIPLSNSDAVVVRENESPSLNSTPTTMIPTGTEVSSMEFDSPRATVDNGTAVAFLRQI